MKIFTDSKLGLGLNQGPWSCDLVMLPNVVPVHSLVKFLLDCLHCHITFGHNQMVISPALCTSHEKGNANIVDVSASHDNVKN